MVGSMPDVRNRQKQRQIKKKTNMSFKPSNIMRLVIKLCGKCSDREMLRVLWEHSEGTLHGV